MDNRKLSRNPSIRQREATEDEHIIAFYLQDRLSYEMSERLTPRIICEMANKILTPPEISKMVKNIVSDEIGDNVDDGLFEKIIRCLMRQSIDPDFVNVTVYLCKHDVEIDPEGNNIEASDHDSDEGLHSSAESSGSEM